MCVCSGAELYVFSEYRNIYRNSVWKIARETRSGSDGQLKRFGAQSSANRLGGASANAGADVGSDAGSPRCRNRFSCLFGFCCFLFFFLFFAYFVF